MPSFPSIYLIPFSSPALWNTLDTAGIRPPSCWLGGISLMYNCERVLHPGLCYANWQRSGLRFSILSQLSPVLRTSVSTKQMKTESVGLNTRPPLILWGWKFSRTPFLCQWASWFSCQVVISGCWLYSLTSLYHLHQLKKKYKVSFQALFITECLTDLLSLTYLSVVRIHWKIKIAFELFYILICFDTDTLLIHHALEIIFSCSVENFFCNRSM